MAGIQPVHYLSSKATDPESSEVPQKLQSVAVAFKQVIAEPVVAAVPSTPIVTPRATQPEPTVYLPRARWTKRESTMPQPTIHWSDSLSFV